MIYLGIDPGANCLGYATVFSISSDISEFKIINSGIIKFKKSDSIGKKLIFMYDFFQKLILNLKKDDAAVPFYVCLETQFVSKNPKSAFSLTLCRGIFILLAEQHNCFYEDITPAEVKKIITGNGAADKNSVYIFLRKIFPQFLAESLEESDALSIALSIALKVNLDYKINC